MDTNLCKCSQPPFHYLDYDKVYLGISSDYEEASVETCKVCGAKWLNLLIEEESFRKSGRWWRAPIDPVMAKTMTADDSRAFIESSIWCFIGGSYWAGNIYIQERPIKVF